MIESAGENGQSGAESKLVKLEGIMCGILQEEYVLTSLIRKSIESTLTGGILKN